MSSALPLLPYGALAQLVEHLLCKQGVNGSNPLGSTTSQHFPEMKTTVSAGNSGFLADLPPFFDIVNGF